MTNNLDFNETRPVAAEAAINVPSLEKPQFTESTIGLLGVTALKDSDTDNLVVSLVLGRKTEDYGNYFD